MNEVRSNLSGEDSSSDDEDAVLDRKRGQSYYDIHKESIFSRRSTTVQVEDEEGANNSCNKRWQLKIYSPLYTGITTSLNILSLSQLLSGQILLASHPSLKQLNLWGSAAVMINAFFFFDLTLNIAVFGFFYIVESKKVLLIEIVLQGLAIYADCIFFTGGKDRDY